MDITRVRTKAPASENMIALINIIFLLLVFFMLAGTLTTSDVLVVDSPESKSIATSSHSGIDVLFSEAGLMALEGDVMDRVSVLQALERRVLETPELEVSLAADSRLKATELVDFLRQLREIGVDNLILKTELKL